MRLIRCLMRDISKEVHVSRNIGESRAFGCLRAILCLAGLMKAVCCGLRAMRREQIGSAVIHEGCTRFICNWAGSQSPTVSGEDFYREHVPRAEIVNVINVRELWHRFSFGVEFYSGYHMNNDINKRLYPQLFARPNQ